MIEELLNYQILKFDEFKLTAGNIFFTILFLLIAPVFYLFVRKLFLLKYYRKQQLNPGRAYAISTIVKYIIYVMFFIFAMQASGFNISVLLAAGAALLVGIGIGLQQTFNDFASGFILLVEGSVQKGDWVEIGNTEGKVIKIGLRTSLIETRRKVTIIVPNSKITVDNVINLSHQDNRLLRYTIEVGVAYGSDVQKVKNVLLECADNHPGVLKDPKPAVRFENFGDSSLDFELLFWSDDFQNIQIIKSDLRFLIDEAFRKNNIQIPFPQRDLHIKTIPRGMA
jgi:small-conductance mechanosensitive channel